MALERNRWIQSRPPWTWPDSAPDRLRVKQFGLEKLIKEQRGHGRSG